MSGILYLVATPIGNLEDITLRALKVLEEADIIACEDTRHTIKLLNHFGIKKSLISYHEHNKFEKGLQIVEAVANGKKVALVTDAGTPAISDPGEDIVGLMIEHQLEYTSIPGPVAAINALILSGKDTRRFCFEGFLPHQKKEKQQVLNILKEETRTIILYESPHRIKKTLAELLNNLGDRKITLTRELTKKFEEKLVTTIQGAIEHYNEVDPRGEYVLIIEGIGLEGLAEIVVNKWLEMSLEDHLEYYMEKGLSKKEAIKQIAKDRNVPKREVYQYFIS